MLQNTLNMLNVYTAPKNKNRNAYGHKSLTGQSSAYTSHVTKGFIRRLIKCGS